MASKIIKIAAGIVTFGALFGLATAVKAEDKNIRVKQPAKSCTWVAKEAKHTQVVASGGTHDEANGEKWKCTNGSWKQIAGPPAKDTRPN